MKKTFFTISILSFFAAFSGQTTNNLATSGGHEVGLTGSRYIYREPRFMSNRGYKFGIEYTWTYAQEKWFGKVDFRFANGQVKYNGGTINLDTGAHKEGLVLKELTNYYSDFRLLFGKDFQVNEQLLAPYIGFGYRYLFNDLDSSSSSGYTRESHYWYLPIGLTYRINLNDRAKLETTIEYDHFIKGKQIGIKHSENDQSEGYGFRLSTVYNKDNWSFGPYYQYWNIKESDVDYIFHSRLRKFIGFLEPKNHTSEFGIRLRYKF